VKRDELRLQVREVSRDLEILSRDDAASARVRELATRAERLIGYLDEEVRDYESVHRGPW
jgi:hypothetical protein